jgi:cysteinyl-tRNA synthetase
VQLAEKAWREFEARMDDDFSTREAIAAMYELAREANKLQSEGKLSRKGAGSIVSVLDRFNGIFDVLVTVRGGEDLSGKLVDLLLKVREDARKRKDFAQADLIRKQLLELGIEIQDTQDGAVWKRK